LEQDTQENVIPKTTIRGMDTLTTTQVAESSCEALLSQYAAK